MNDEIVFLKKKYEDIASSSEVFESKCYESIMNFFSYKKISKGAFYNIIPYEIQRAGFKIGRILKSLPKAIKNTRVYYFDNKDNILLIEVYGQSENVIDRHYYFYSEQGIESIYFNSGTKTIRNIDFSKMEKGQIIEVLNYGRVGSSTSKYFYQEGLLTEIHVQQKQHGKDDIISYNVYFEYKDGVLDKIIDRHPNGYEEQRYP